MTDCSSLGDESFHLINRGGSLSCKENIMRAVASHSFLVQQIIFSDSYCTRRSCWVAATTTCIFLCSGSIWCSQCTYHNPESVLSLLLVSTIPLIKGECSDMFKEREWLSRGTKRRLLCMAALRSIPSGTEGSTEVVHYSSRSSCVLFHQECPLSLLVCSQYYCHGK